MSLPLPGGSDNSNVLRARAPFASFPPRQAWELLRRHPVYLANWQAGNAYYRLSEEQRRQAPAELVQAVEALRHIGASGPCYPSPRMPPEELEAGKEDAAGAWPLQVRSLVQALATLPPESRKPIGRLLAGDGDLGQVLRNLDAMDDHHLDAFVRGLVRINLHQSTKGVLAAVEEIVKSQQQLNIPAVRQRFDVLEDQLRVWDLREGWTGEGYDANAEKRMRDIAQTLDIPLSTVQGRYEAAFQQLFGYPYTPERWAAWVLPIKADIGKWAGWRRSKSRREGQRQPAVGAEGAAVAYGDQETRELMMDLESLFARGWSNERIAAELKLSVKDVAYLRRRFVDTDEAASA